MKCEGLSTNLSSLTAASLYNIEKFRGDFLANVDTVQRVISPVLIAIGVLGNICSALVWASPHIRHGNSSAIYLTVLCVSDLTLLVTYAVKYVELHWNVRMIAYSNASCIVFHSIFMTGQYLSVPLVTVFTIERWYAVYYPLRRHTFCTTRRACIATATLTGLIGAIGVINGQAYSYENPATKCTIAKAWRSGLSTKLWMSFVELIVSVLLPCLTLIFNVFVICKLRRVAVKRQQMGVHKHDKLSSQPRLLSPSDSCFTTTRHRASARTDSKTQRAGSFTAQPAQLVNHKLSVISNRLTVECVYVAESRFAQADKEEEGGKEEKGGKEEPRGSCSRHRLDNLPRRFLASFSGTATPLAAALSSSNNMKFRTTNILLLAVSFYQILTTLPAGIMYLAQHFIAPDTRNVTVDQVCRDPTWIVYRKFQFVKMLIDLFSVTHFSFNIFIYLTIGKQFRRQFFQLFIKCNGTAAVEEHVELPGKMISRKRRVLSKPLLNEAPLPESEHSDEV